MAESIYYMYHVDNLRRKKKMTVEQLCFGICSDRQYRRLLSGEQNISDFKVEQFCNKLGISIKDFYYSASEKDRYEYKRIATLYTNLINSDFEQYSINLKSFRFDQLSIQNKRFLDFCVVKYNFLTHKLTPQDAYDKLTSLCNYPSCKDHKAFDFVDIISLEIMAEIEVSFDKTVILDLLLRILSDTEVIYISSESKHILPNIYGTVAILLSRLNRFDDSLSISQKGIYYSRKHSNFDTLSHLFFVEFFSLLKMDKRKDAEISAIKCISNAISRGNQKELSMFLDEIKKELGVNPFELFQVHFSEIL